MKLIQFYQKIRSLALPVFNTEDVSAAFKLSNKQGYKLLKQLADENFIVHLRRGLWAVSESVDSFMVPDYLTAPLPSYISLQSALYYHGMVSQIPSVIYAVSLARTRRYFTPIGVYSIHHIIENLFFDFDVIGDKAIRMAKPEKALFDFLYFKSAKSHLFHALPEVEIPRKFNWKKLQNYASKINNLSRKSMVLASIDKLTQSLIFHRKDR